MTVVLIRRNSKNGYFIDVQEHSGDDMVCCAVSMLVQTVFCTFENEYRGRVRTKLESGACSLDFDGRGADTRAAKHYIEVIRTGFEMLEKKYPQNIKLFLKL